MGYAPGCDQDKIINAVQSGVNVLFWFSIALVNDGGVPAITGGPDLDCIASTAATLTSLGLVTTHMVSVGGWDAPHPTTDFPAEEMYAAFKDWNESKEAGRHRKRISGMAWRNAVWKTYVCSECGKEFQSRNYVVVPKVCCAYPCGYRRRRRLSGV